MAKGIELFTVDKEGAISPINTLPSLKNDACLLVDHDKKRILVFVGEDVPTRVRVIYFTQRAAINMNVSRYHRGYDIDEINEDVMKKYLAIGLASEIEPTEAFTIQSIFHMYSLASTHCLGMVSQGIFKLFGREAAMEIASAKKSPPSQDLATTTKNIITFLVNSTPWLNIRLEEQIREMRKIRKGELISFAVQDILNDCPDSTSKDAMTLFLSGFVAKLFEISSGFMVESQENHDQISVYIDIEVFGKIE